MVGYPSPAHRRAGADLSSGRFAALLRSPTVLIGGGLAAGQAVVYAATPLVTRLYSPSELGVAGVFLALASIFGAVSTLRFDMALARTDRADARWVTAMAARSVLVIALLSGAGYAVGVSDITEWALLWDAMLFAGTVAGLGLVALGTQWSARRAEFGDLAGSKASQGVVQVLVQVVAGAGGMTARGLQLGFCAGYLTSAATQGRRHLRSVTRLLLSPPPAGASSNDLWRQSLYLTAATLVNMSTVWSYPLLVRWWYGVDQAGILTIAQRLAIAPAGLAVAAVAPAVVTAAGRSLRDGQPVWPVARRWLLRLTPLGAAVGAALVLVPQPWVAAVLGAQWSAVQGYLAVMSPLIATLLVVGPVSQLLSAGGHSASQLIWDVSRAVSVVTAFMVAAALGAQPPTAVLVSSSVLAMFYVVYVIALHRRSRASGGRAAAGVRSGPGEAA